MQLAREIYDEALAADVLLYPKDGALAYKAARGIPALLKQRIQANKQALLDFLLQAEGGNQPMATSAGAITVLQQRQLLPVSRAQQRVWFACQQSDDGSQFNIQGCFVFDGVLEQACFSQALQALVKRHEVLRVHFFERDGQLCQQVADDSQAVLQYLDLVSVAEQTAQIASIIAADLHQVFDLTQELPVRVKLLKLDAQRHLAIFNLHHIIADGWSVGLLIEEFCQSYAAIHGGAEPRSTPDALQYADFSAWQESQIKGGALQAGLAYWRTQLQDMPEVHSLPLDSSRPAQQDFDGAVCQRLLPAPVAQRVQAFCQSRKITLFMFLESLLATVLRLYGGENDIAIGTPVAGRVRPETESMIGLFINTVVLRSKIDLAHSFEHLLEQQREQILQAFAQQHVPLEKLIVELAHRRSASYSPLFQIWFVLQNNRQVEFSLPNCKVSAYQHLPAPAAKFELNLYAQEVAGEIQLDWVYRRTLFAADSIAYVADEFCRLLNCVLDAPHLPLAAQPVFLPTALPSLNATPQTASQSEATRGLLAALHQRLHDSADAPAIVCNGLRWTYQQLAEQEQAYRDAIAASDSTGPIALLYTKGPQIVAAMLAALGLQRSYLMLDPEYPQARLSYMLRHAGCGLVLTDAKNSRLAEQLAEGRKLLIDLPSSPVPSVALGVAAETDFAYILYTSGSTGQPKGVLQTHGGLGYQADSYRRVLGLTAQDRLLQLASYSFDASVLDTYGCLLAGASVHLADLRSSSAEAILALIQRQQISVFHATPTVFKYIFAQAAMASTSSVRMVVLGGEAVDEQTLRLFRRTFGENCRLLGLYGASEASFVSLAEIDITQEQAAGSKHLGQAIQGTEIRICKDDGSPARVFETGEITIRGANLAHGYWADAALSAARFQAIGDGRVDYRSGDMGYLLPDGHIRFVGRRDQQVKLNGIRIELGEVEIALRQLDDVAEVAVLIAPVPENEGTGRLQAYLVSHAWLASDARSALQASLIAQYRSALQQWLPDYMIPAGFAFLERLPSTPSGKTDYRALRQLDAQGLQLDTYLAPSNAHEKALCLLWQQVLQREKIGVCDDFFNLGGNSLLALRLISRIREKFGVQLSVRELFTHTTIQALALQLERLQFAAQATEQQVDTLLATLASKKVQIFLEGSALKTRAPARAITPELGAEIRRLRAALMLRLQESAQFGGEKLEEGKAYALSFAQQRLWFLNHFSQASVGYNMPMALRLEGPLDRAALSRALEEILQRHSILRTNYYAQQEQGVQVIEAFNGLPLAHLDLQHLSQAEQAHALNQLARAEQAKLFDLQHDKMIRASLAQVAPQAHLLFLTLHHIAADGWSLGILAREFCALYQAFSQQQPSPLPPLAMQYADFALWQRQHLGPEQVQQHLQYWREQLDGIAQLHSLPLDKPRPLLQTSTGRVVRRQLDADLLAALKALGASQQASLFMVLQAAFALLVARWSAENDVVIATPVAGRTLAASEHLIGCFVNTLVLRTRLDADMSFTDLLRISQQQLLAAYEHQQAPFELLVEALNPERSPSHSPLFQLMFALQNYQMETIQLPGLTVQEVLLDEPYAKFDLSLIAHEDEAGLSMHWVYAEALFEASSVTAMAAGLENLLQAIIDAPNGNIFDLRLQSAAAASQLQAQANSLSQIVLDARGKPQVVGALGEIHQLDDTGVAQWRAAGLLGRNLANGQLQALARLVPGQISHINGVRIPSLEIEAVLAEVAELAEVHVALRELALSASEVRRVIVAYLCLVPGANQQQVLQQCQTLLQQRLPSYLLPKSLLVLESLARNAEGQVDQDRLPLPDAQMLRPAYAEPQDELERQLCAIWCEVLSLERVGINDNFFEVGGTSLHCILMQQEILQRTKHQVSVTDLFSYPSVASLAEHLRNDGQSKLEHMLATLWQALCAAENLVADDLNALHASPLLAGKFLAQIESQFKLALPSAIFSANMSLPTLAQAILASEHGPALLSALRQMHDASRVAANLITPESSVITPQMLPLIDLNQADIDHIVAQVPGGISNIQDIYALTPLQEGILFHHRLASEGDPYLLRAEMSFPSLAKWEQFLIGVQQVVARHDVLRTCFFWQGISKSAQVVLRQVEISVTELQLDPEQGPIDVQLKQHYDAQLSRLDLRTAPLLSYVIAHDPLRQRWIVQQRFHHLLGDHTALNMLREEVHIILRGEAASLAPAIPYRNMVAHILSKQNDQEDEKFFRAMLADIEEPSLPFGLNRAHNEGSDTAEAHLMLPQALQARLRLQTSKHGVTLASLSHLAMGLVLARCANREHVVFGTVLLGRMQAGELEGRAMGLSMNTLPFRLDIGALGVADALRKTHQQLTALLKHEQASLALAQRCSAVPSKTPLFNTLLNYRHNAAPSSAPMDAQHPFAGIDFGAVEEWNNYAISLAMTDDGQSLNLIAQVVAPLSASRFCAYMQQAMAAIVQALETQVQTSISALAILPPEERELLLHRWNATDFAYPHALCVHQLFEAQVQRSPQAVALRGAQSNLSYAELNQQANRLAHQLLAQGAHADQVIALCVQRGPAMLIGLLAILKAGAAYLPLDPSYPSDRLGKVLNDAAPQIVLADAAGRAALGSTVLAGRSVLAMDGLQDASSLPAWAQQSAENPQLPSLHSQQLAYVMYTSGSTGMPKGVQIEHRQLHNFLASMAEKLAMQPSHTWLAVTSIAFDIAGLELYLPLITGASIVLASHTDALDPQRLQALMQEQHVNIMQATPATWKAMIASGWQGQADLHVLCGGEAMPLHFPGWFTGRCAALWNLYGPTETTIWSSAAQLLPATEAAQMVSIGRPIANTRIYLLDAAKQPVPIGAIGELYIAGDGVARAYLQRPELNAAHFMADPFVLENTPAAGTQQRVARMYRTGDLARYHADGMLECLGRNDDQVKIRGFRIELGEIEACLNRHPQVAEAAVAVRADGTGQRLIGYAVGQSTYSEASEEYAQRDTLIRKHLQASLPDYMVPAALIWLASLPLTANGKLDRKALPDPAASAYVHRAYSAPIGPQEIALAQLWQQVLKVEQVGRDDDFFELGGHSLLAVALLAKIRQVMGCELPVLSLFNNPKLADLAHAISRLASESADAAWSPIPQLSRADDLPLSYAQQRMWFLAQWQGASAQYHMPLMLHLRGQLDIVALRAALHALLQRHEALRSVFELDDGQPRLRLLAPDSQLQLREDILQTEALQELSRAEFIAPFDLSQGPLMRARLLRLSGDEHILQLTQHHIVSDGWSMNILAHDLAELYTAFHTGRASQLAELPIQYVDYAAWQRQWLSGAREQQQGQYWRDNLSGAPSLLELPTDRARPEQQDFTAAQIPITFDAHTTAALKAFSQRHGATLFMSLLAAWAAVLARLSGQNDVVIGAPVANRRRPEVQQLIGLFVNTLALRLQLAPTQTAAQLLAQVRATVLAAQDHQDLPFEQVVEIIQPPRRMSHTPIFQVMLNWQGTELALPKLDGVELELAATGYVSSKCDLELSLSERDAQVCGNLTYATSLFDAATMQRHVGYLQNMVAAMLADEAQALQQVDLLCAAERQMQLETWNATRAAYPQNICLHQLFEQQVEKAPSACALLLPTADGAQTLSYAELNAQANQLAHHLLASGVQLEDRVAICLDRSAAMVVGLLAILKAGAAYVPLDPAYPAQRLAHILQDAAPKAILSDAVGRQALQGLALPGSAWIDVAKSQDWASQSSQNPQVAGLGPRNLAYVIYTSGSTGMPKGVMNEHGPVVNRLSWMQDAYRLDASDVVIQKTPFSFDVSVWEFFWTLLYGAKLLVAPPEVHKDPHALIQLIQQYAVTTAHFVPSMLGLFLSTDGVEACRQLRRIICSGEALQPAHALAYLAKLPGAQLHNLYGPTEAAIDVTAWTCPADYRGGAVPIGRPISNLRIYVLDADLRPVPLGVAGSLYIGGIGVARGYHHLPELTAERFVSDPFVADPTARMYHTGDLVRYRVDGNLDYLGRDDFQVKLRGLRIELGEIEAKLVEHEQVSEAVVMLREIGSEQRLVAYLLEAKLASALPAAELFPALHAHLAKSLPDYMLPTACVLMQAWPLTPNGKLDRKALPLPAAEAYQRQAFAEPEGELEQIVAAIWQQLLEVPEIGRHDGFFTLGGSSLLAVRMLSELHKQLNVRIDLAILFKHTNLADFCRQVLLTLIEQEIGAEEFENFIISEGQSV